MYANEFMRQYAAGERNFNESVLSEVNLVKTSLSGEKLDGGKLSGEKLDAATTPDGTMLLVPIYFLAITGALVFLKLSKSYKGVLNRISTLNPLHQVPCKNCRFFTDNQYLKCAVHPSTVLKQQAINCPDYWSQNGKAD